MANYVPKPIATVEDWLGVWLNRPRYRIDITQPPSIPGDRGDTVHLQIDDLGATGGPGPNAKELKRPISPLSITTDLDLAKFRFRFAESVTVMNTITLDSGVVTLTLMVAPPDQSGSHGQIIRFHRQIDESEFLVTTVDLTKGDVR